MCCPQAICIEPVKIVVHDVRFRCCRFEVCELSELLFKHAFDGLWHGGFVGLVKDIRCDLVDA